MFFGHDINSCWNFVFNSQAIPVRKSLKTYYPVIFTQQLGSHR
ncbi:MAG: hypothetical protein UU83_C0054G0005 [Candidatus Jorgensenbacteria bacterium GW2011_GWF2_41_8]|uniref:Uncharacterized protein n=1 Tax=Candidatus Jorgensenbacteria bacterium GW2011_GWF2_41_8 TaxID=1618667 RepID=A0A0G0XEI5_9BACT|nr:MAG: hypothetical protein UU83_C0054G0005 [Candidatus Jorgensenbacteria bacterium GW2011_GWF2_41_8]